METRQRLGSPVRIGQSYRREPPADRRFEQQSLPVHALKYRPARPLDAIPIAATDDSASADVEVSNSKAFTCAERIHRANDPGQVFAIGLDGLGTVPVHARGLPEPRRTAAPDTD